MMQEAKHLSRILVVDDDADFHWAISRLVASLGASVESALNASECIGKFRPCAFDAVILDLRLPDKNGISLLQEIASKDRWTPVIIMTGYGDVASAVEAMKAGAHDFITKPFDNDHLRFVLHRAMRQRRTQEESEDPRNGSGEADSLANRMGRSRAVANLSRDIERVARTDYSVVIQGETGSGKEVVARHIHKQSTRAGGPFYAMDCGAIPENLMESELFGHNRGAFTGADKRQEGFFAAAKGGTVLLDEVTGLNVRMQQKFLRALEEKEFLPLGQHRPIKMDVRVLVATNESLTEAVRKKKVRLDFYHRLSEYAIEVPPLRERREDIPYLAERFLRETNEQIGAEAKGFSPEAMDRLLEYDYPGNVRELRNIVRQAALLAESIVLPLHLPFGEGTARVRRGGDVRGAVREGVGLKEIVREAARRAEGQAVTEALKLANGSRAKAAEVLNIDRKTLYRKIGN